ncbi:MAG TPA: hypothetical protein ENH55_10805 [Aurantimonas coralicida]|uniref:Uncharacterized protein n=2 Tax=root TaxID=1 RepID=A0A9C9TFT5_9HYPH|nr:hypothetical protein [Aurantimonas coralicida]HET99448.1 hypothetical protein [Aurantimonas coralicida]
MRVEEVSNLDALLFVTVLVAISAIILRLVPRRADMPKLLAVFSETEIAAHDRALPKYILTSAAALVLGPLHLAVKSVPAISTWLEGAGRGGHLAANIAYSHMIIVMGGTIAVTGLTWYALPRVLRRPLYSETLAQLAFWGTVLGAGGFYLVNLLGGVAMSVMVHGGMTDAAASDAIGLWRSLPTAAAASLMGVGYWIFVVNVLVTCWLSRRVAGPQPLGHLSKFFVIGSVGLLVGTVQGVLQVVPENEDWLAAAGQAGRYIDPISHAHVNLLTGMMMLVAGLVFFLIGSRDGAEAGRRAANLVFWTLGPGSIALYLAFLTLGMAEGGLIVDQGLTFPQAVARMGAWQAVPLLGSAAVVLSGLWLLLATILRHFVRGFRQTPGTALICLGAAVLLVGTLQGGVQALPAVKMWMVAAGAGGEAVARTHAQTNMLGGVLTILTGMALMIGRPMLGAAPPPRLGLRMAVLMGAGVGLYYTASMLAAIVSGQAIRAGVDAGDGSLPLAAGAVIAGALLYAAAAALLLRFVWAMTADYRKTSWLALKTELSRHDAPEKPWRGRIPSAALLLPEAAGALTGFPGLGWILSGRAAVGVPLMFGGPALAWAVLPLALSPYGPIARPDTVFVTIESYLVISAAISVLTLWTSIAMRRLRRDADNQG